MQKLFHFVYLLPLILSAIFSLKVFRLKWAKPYKLFSFFLFLTLFVEAFAIAWKLYLFKTNYWSYSKSNAWIYNSFFIPEYSFYMYFYYKVLRNKVIKKMFLPLLLLYTIGGLINLFFVQSFYSLNTYNIIAGNLVVIFFSLNYFNERLNQKEIINVSTEPLFWISLGAFIFNTVSLPYFIFINYLSKTNIAMAIALFNILLILNIFMYSIYLIAFLCNKPSQK